MYSKPILNDPGNPLISVLIHNYDGRHLRQCFDSIFSQNVLENIEVIFFDDASAGESWELAQEYAQKHRSIITLTRNKRSVGQDNNFRNGVRMVRGSYYVPLFDDRLFSPEYVKQCVQTMECDQFAEFAVVRRAVNKKTPLPNIKKTPLVSITVHNYNYGRYLRECFDSVFAQTYDNVEICFSDNASTDDSWDIALEYGRRYPGMMYLTRNRINFGSDANFANCLVNVGGKYLVELCSDDALAPEFVEKCVHALESHPEAGFAMVHRTIIDENGRRTEEPPFYNQTCLIPGPEQAAVYMMASVNPSISQIMYNKGMTTGKAVVGGLAGGWYGTRIMDFNMCCEYPIIYIKEPLLLHRIHSQNESFRVAENLMEIIGPYILQHQFAELAAPYNLTKVIDRLPPSLEKLGKLCLRYSMRSLCANDERPALRYFNLAIAILPDITFDPTFKLISEYWETDAAGKLKIVESLKSIDNLATRSVSYDPPSNSIPIEINPQKPQYSAKR
ncbi:MAG: glycosyltransferase family 2 protein [Syntrophobacteraceae bacterium]|jgi:glycosyltransferase involved in cell wall biosynthesis